MPGKFKIIDLSLPIEPSNQEFIHPTIKFISHKKGANLLGLAGMISEKSPIRTVLNFLLYYLGIRKINYKNFPDGLGLAWEQVKMETHAGTHLDAPWHFGPITAGQRSKTIDQIPLDWCYGNGVLLDLRNECFDNIIRVREFERACEKIKYNIKPKDIILIMTGSDKFSNSKKYLFKYPGMSREALFWLLDKGVKIIGTDTWGFDRSFEGMAKTYLHTKDARDLWPAHMAGREREYCHIEKLVNLDKIPIPFGFKIAAFPIKIKNASAAWIRAVAIIEDGSAP
jgi:kynurenine formamidase